MKYKVAYQDKVLKTINLLLVVSSSMIFKLPFVPNSVFFEGAIIEKLKIAGLVLINKGNPDYDHIKVTKA